MIDKKGQELVAGDIIKWDNRNFYIVCPDHRPGFELQLVCLTDYKWMLSRPVTVTELHTHAVKVGTMPDLEKVLNEI